MLSLREYRHAADRLADHLPWAALVTEGVILNKDGSFQRTLAFRGPDLESATEAELVSASARANNVLRRFGSGWALFFEAERRPALGYPDSSFPDTASWLVDRERRGRFGAGGAARAIAGGGLGAIRAGTAMGSAARTAYTLGQEGAGSSSVGAGLGGVARAAGGAARSRMSAALGIGEAAESGRQAAWQALNPKSDTGAAAGATAASGDVPGWARAMKAQQSARYHRQTAAHAIAQGDRGGSGATPDLDERND